MADEGVSGVHGVLVQGRYFSPEGGERCRYTNSEGWYGVGEVEGVKGKDGGRDDVDGRRNQQGTKGRVPVGPKGL